MAFLLEFSRALDDVEARIDSDKAQELLQTWAERVSGSAGGTVNHALVIVSDYRWKQLRVRVGDTLISATLTHSSPLYIRFLMRLMLAIGLIEALAMLDPGESLLADQLAFLYLIRVVILPSFVTPYSTLDDRLAASKGPGSFFARAPAFSDHVVVREEWSCYVAGEIAHIENVLRGEKKEREGQSAHLVQHRFPMLPTS